MHPEKAMTLAIGQAEIARDLGEVPIGAVVVNAEGEVIGVGHNMTESWDDPTAHAEIMAIRDAARRTGDWRLSGCSLYVTLEPCMMCAGAIQLSRIDHVYFGPESPKSGAIHSLLHAYEIEGLNHYPQVTAGILSDKCAIMLADFFRGKRNTVIDRDMRRDVRVVEGARLESE